MTNLGLHVHRTDKDLLSYSGSNQARSFLAVFSLPQWVVQSARKGLAVYTSPPISLSTSNAWSACMSTFEYPFSKL